MGFIVANANKDRFDQRLAGLGKKNDPTQRVEKRVREDGLVVHVAKSNGKKRGLLPIKGILIAAALFVMLKAFLFAELGEVEYLERVEGLKQGGAVQVSAAFLLDADPATRTVASFLKKTLQ